MPSQPRDALGRFATAECPRVYALIDALADRPEEPPVGGYYTPVPAPRCPHGHFARWAAAADPRTGKPNCPRCHRNLPG